MNFFCKCTSIPESLQLRKNIHLRKEKTQQQRVACFLMLEPVLNVLLALNPYYCFGKTLLGAHVRDRGTVALDSHVTGPKAKKQESSKA